MSYLCECVLYTELGGSLLLYHCCLVGVTHVTVVLMTDVYDRYRTPVFLNTVYSHQKHCWCTFRTSHDTSGLFCSDFLYFQIFQCYVGAGKHPGPFGKRKPSRIQKSFFIILSKHIVPSQSYRTLNIIDLIIHQKIECE